MSEVVRAVLSGIQTVEVPVLLACLVRRDSIAAKIEILGDDPVEKFASIKTA